MKTHLANSEDPDLTVPEGVVSSGSSQFTMALLSKYFVSFWYIQGENVVRQRKNLSFRYCILLITTRSE